MTPWTRAFAGRERRRPAPLLSRSRFGPILCGAVLIGIACQAGPPPDPKPTGPAPSDAPTPTAAASRIPTGGTLRVGVPIDIGLLDPAGGDVVAEPIHRQLFEGLVQPLGDRVVGRLATAWTVAADGRTWTFTLREGVVFHDGTSFDAAAAARSLTRLIDRPGGVDPVLDSAVATGPTTLTVTLRTAFAPFLRLLGTPRYAIVQSARPSVGTGPFLLVPGTELARPLVLERNPAYWRTDAAGRALPYLDRVVFQAYPDATAGAAALRSGAVDLVTELSIGDVPTVRADPSLQLVARPAVTVLSLAMNLAQPPFDDLRIRQAVAAAVNRRALVDRLYAGAGSPATQFLPPGTLGYDDSIAEFSRNDPGAAKKLLAEAGKPAFEIDLWYVQGMSPAQPDARRVAESIAAELAAVGITAVLKTIDPVTFVLSARDNRYALWLDSTTLTAGDPDEILGRLFIPPVVGGRDGPTTGGAWTDREAAGLLRKARTEPDESKRSELYKQVTKIVQLRIPRVPLVWSAAPAAATRKVIDPLAFWSGAAAIGK